MVASLLVFATGRALLSVASEHVSYWGPMDAERLNRWPHDIVRRPLLGLVLAQDQCDFCQRVCCFIERVTPMTFDLCYDQLRAIDRLFIQSI